MYMYRILRTPADLTPTLRAAPFCSILLSCSALLFCSLLPPPALGTMGEGRLILVYFEAQGDGIRMSVVADRNRSSVVGHAREDFGE